MGVFKSIFSLKNIVNQSSTVISGNTKITNSKIGNISINGNNIVGNNITVIGNKVYVDGKELTEYSDSKTVNINIVGDVDSIEGGNNIVITGNVREVNSYSGDIEVKGNVEGSVESRSGDINISENVGGNVETVSGDVRAKAINGNVKTVSGDIN